jgi:CheY-like chemotaxis protein
MGADTGEVGKTVLVCDDTASLRELVSEALAEGGYTIVEARDGDESLELARRVRPDLIVLDVVMPGRSGFDVLAELRKSPALARTPVVVCTASARAIDRDLARTLGIDRFLHKPFSPLELASVVEGLLGEPTGP